MRSSGPPLARRFPDATTPPPCPRPCLISCLRTPTTNRTGLLNAAGSLAAGVPFQWLPAPLVAACGLSLFYESRSLREYLVFVVGAFLTGEGSGAAACGSAWSLSSGRS